jgi:hypothetical protein
VSLAPRPYKRGNAPSLPGSDRLYLDAELRRIEQSQGLLPDITFPTKAALLARGAYRGQIAFISDPVSNKNMVFFDGTDWRYPDGNLV